VVLEPPDTHITSINTDNLKVLQQHNNTAHASELLPFARDRAVNPPITQPTKDAALLLFVTGQN
jgi:hypothetical protein